MAQIEVSPPRIPAGDSLADQPDYGLLDAGAVGEVLACASLGQAIDGGLDRLAVLELRDDAWIDVGRPADGRRVAQDLGDDLDDVDDGLIADRLVPAWSARSIAASTVPFQVRKSLAV